MKYSKLLSIALFLTVGASKVLAQEPDSGSNSGANPIHASTGANAGMFLSGTLRQYGRAGRKSPSASSSAGPSSFAAQRDFNLKPSASGGSLQVLGDGTVGRLTKWLGETGSNSVIGETGVFEDKSGHVGIGTDSPGSRLTVAGVIESLSGGIKFPDGTVQISSAAASLFSITHDATLIGSGAPGVPLGLAIPLTLSGAANSKNLIDVTNIADGGGVSGTGVIGLAGNGTTGNLAGGTGVAATGGSSLQRNGGPGLVSHGGAAFSPTSVGGGGIAALGGTGGAGGGSAVSAIGGDAIIKGPGGDGIDAFGGNTPSGLPGVGIFAMGGTGTNGIRLSAGTFEGDVGIIGNLLVGGVKSFKIDHPLDPENRYLLHAAIESSEVLNVYSGNTVLDQNGEAVVTMPEWFEAINKDLRYGLTAIGAPAPGLYIAEEVKGGHFRIGGGPAGVKVSWQVTGVRSDPAMRAEPFVAEQDKNEFERGRYLQPQLYGKPEELSVHWRHIQRATAQRH